MGVDESGIGDRVGRVGKRFKIRGVLRDALRQKSMGVIEEIPEKGIVKYAKPAGVIASLVPATNPELTPPVTGIYALKVQGRGDLLAASAQQEDDRSRWSEVMRETLEAARRAGGHFPVHRARPSIPLTRS